MKLELENEQDIEPRWLDINETDAPGFRVKVRYIAPDTLTRMQAKCVETVRGTRGGQDRQTTDTVKWSSMIVEKVVVDWEGLTLPILEKMVPPAKSTREAMIAAGPKATLPYSKEAADILARKAQDRMFAGPIVRFVTDWSEFSAREQEAEKNGSAA